MERKPFGVRIFSGDADTSNTPHKVYVSGSTTYYVAKSALGDYAIHHHTARNEHGYGGGLVDFLLEDGSHRLVRGPFYGSGIWDQGVSKALREATGYDASIAATKIVIGYDLCTAIHGQSRTVLYEETEWNIEDAGAKIARILGVLTLPNRFQVQIVFREGTRTLTYPDHFEKQKN